MRESGFLGLLRIIFECVRDAFGLRRAWTVMAVIALILSAPFLLFALLVYLLTLVF